MASSLLSVSWKEHSCELAAVCKNLLAEDFLVDCTIAAEGQKLKAHRLILSACSPYFRMLFSEEAEKHPIVILKDTLFDSLKAVVDFVYHGETQIPEGQLQAFLQLAENLQIKGLNNSPFKDRNKDLCCNMAVVNVSPSLLKDNQNTYEVRCASASHEDSAENSSQPLRSHLYPSDEHTDAVQSNAVVSCERLTESCEEVQSASEVSPPHEQRILPDCEERSVDVETIVKQEPLYSEFLETNTEGLDDIASDDPMSGNFTNERHRGTTSTFCGQDLNQSSILLKYLCQGEATTASQVLSKRPAVPQPELHLHTQILACKETHLCEVCGATFAEAQLLTHHMQTHSLDRPYSCNVCGKIFRQKCHLSDHARIHTGERPFCCHECGLSFRHANSLKHHKSTHTGVRPFHCDVCGLSFTQFCNLKIHQRKHTGERPFRCDVCGTRFMHSGNLASHQRKHTDERPFHCDLCGFSFKQSCNLKRHLRKYHQDSSAKSAE